MLLVAITSKERQTGLRTALLTSQPSAVAFVPLKPVNQLTCQELQPELVAPQSLGYGAAGWCQNSLRSGIFLWVFQMIVLCPVGLEEECKASAVKCKPRQNSSGLVTNASLGLGSQKFTGLLVNLRWTFCEPKQD